MFHMILGKFLEVNFILGKAKMFNTFLFLKDIVDICGHYKRCTYHRLYKK